MKKILMIMLMSFGIGMVSIAQGNYQGNGVYTNSEGMPLNGEVQVKNDQGNLEQIITFKNGLLHGPIISYNADGSVRETGMYKKGVKSGQWMQLDEKGNKVAIAFYEDGLKHGRWYFWSPTGKIAYELEYAKGVAITKRQFNEKGEVTVMQNK
jgi:antitoxin component YwqK of YwqJK toxin-antitoxin module